MFPVPNSTLSYDLAPPSLFLGGKVLPEDFSMNVLYSLGAAIYPCRPNYGIVYKRLVSVGEAGGVRRSTTTASRRR